MTNLDLKFIENYVKNIFNRPFMRKLRFMYFGLDHEPDIFILCNREDVEFKYCESMQTTGLVKLKNPETARIISAWLSSLGIDNTRPMLLYLGLLMTALNKAPWASLSVNVQRDPLGPIFLSVDNEQPVMIARPVDTHFTLTKLQRHVEKYSAVFFDKTQRPHTLSVPDLPSKIITIPVSKSILEEVGVIDATCRDVNLILIPGVDVLQTKSLIQKSHPYETGVRLVRSGSKMSELWRVLRG